MTRRFFVSSARSMLPFARQCLNPRYSFSSTVANPQWLPQIHCCRKMVSQFGSITNSERDSESINEPRSVSVHDALQLLQAGHRYLDVRTRDEFKAGHASGAINIPYMFSTCSGMSKSPNFLEEVSSQFQKDEDIVVGCQSGRRSLMATAYLLSDGFTSVSNVVGGYTAWTQNGLPTDK